MIHDFRETVNRVLLKKTIFGVFPKNEPVILGRVLMYAELELAGGTHCRRLKASLGGIHLLPSRCRTAAFCNMYRSWKPTEVEHILRTMKVRECAGRVDGYQSQTSDPIGEMIHLVSPMGVFSWLVIKRAVADRYLAIGSSFGSSPLIWYFVTSRLLAFP